MTRELGTALQRCSAPTFQISNALEHLLQHSNASTLQRSNASERPLQCSSAPTPQSANAPEYFLQRSNAPEPKRSRASYPALQRSSDPLFPPPTPPKRLLSSRVLSVCQTELHGNCISLDFHQILTSTDPPMCCIFILSSLSG